MKYMKRMMLVCWLLGICMQPAGAGEKPENYCNDPSSWQQWESLCEKYPSDKNIQILHALRIGLCQKVKSGDLTIPQATDIFETARETVIQRKKARQQASEENGRL